MGTRRQTPDGNGEGNGDGNGDGSEDSSGDGNGDDDSGNGTHPHTHINTHTHTWGDERHTHTCSTPRRKTPRRRSRAEEKQVSGLVPRYLLPPSSRYVDMW